MEQTKEIPVAWRDFVLIVLLALLLHGMAWGFWWGVEGRSIVSASAKPAESIAAPVLEEDPQYLVRIPVSSGG